MSTSPVPAGTTRWRLVSTEEYKGLTAARDRDREQADLQARLSDLADRLVAAQILLSELQGEVIRRAA